MGNSFYFKKSRDKIDFTMRFRDIMFLRQLLDLGSLQCVRVEQTGFCEC